MSKRQRMGKTRVGKNKAKQMGINYVPLKSPGPTFRTSNPCPNCGSPMIKDRNGMRCEDCGDPYKNGNGDKNDVQ